MGSVDKQLFEDNCELKKLSKDELMELADRAIGFINKEADKRLATANKQVRKKAKRVIQRAIQAAKKILRTTTDAITEGELNSVCERLQNEVDGILGSGLPQLGCKFTIPPIITEVREKTGAYIRETYDLSSGEEIGEEEFEEFEEDDDSELDESEIFEDSRIRAYAIVNTIMDVVAKDFIILFGMTAAIGTQKFVVSEKDMKDSYDLLYEIAYESLLEIESRVGLWENDQILDVIEKTINSKIMRPLEGDDSNYRFVMSAIRFMMKSCSQLREEPDYDALKENWGKFEFSVMSLDEFESIALQVKIAQSISADNEPFLKRECELIEEYILAGVHDFDELAQLVNSEVHAGIEFRTPENIKKMAIAEGLITPKVIAEKNMEKIRGIDISSPKGKMESIYLKELRDVIYEILDEMESEINEGMFDKSIKFEDSEMTFHELLRRNALVLASKIKLALTNRNTFGGKIDDPQRFDYWFEKNILYHFNQLRDAIILKSCPDSIDEEGLVAKIYSYAERIRQRVRGSHSWVNGISAEEKELDLKKPRIESGREEELNLLPEQFGNLTKNVGDLLEELGLYTSELIAEGISNPEGDGAKGRGDESFREIKKEALGIVKDLERALAIFRKKLENL